MGLVVLVVAVAVAVMVAVDEDEVVDEAGVVDAEVSEVPLGSCSRSSETWHRALDLTMRFVGSESEMALRTLNEFGEMKSFSVA